MSVLTRAMVRGGQWAGSRKLSSQGGQGNLPSQFQRAGYLPAVHREKHTRVYSIRGGSKDGPFPQDFQEAKTGPQFPTSRPQYHIPVTMKTVSDF